MLIFASEVKGESPAPGISAEAINIVKPLLVGTAIIVDNALSEMITIAQRCAGDTEHATIYGPNLSMGTLRILHPLHVRFQFLRNRVVDTTGITIFGSITDLI